MADIRQQVRSFIMENYLKGSDPAALKDDQSLERSHVVDSARVLDLIMYIEETYGFEVTNDDAVPDNFDSIDNIVGYVQRKQGAK